MQLKQEVYSDSKHSFQISHFICNMITQIIERLREAMGAALVDNDFSPILWKISIHMKK